MKIKKNFADSLQYTSVNKKVLKTANANEDDEGDEDDEDEEDDEDATKNKNLVEKANSLQRTQLKKIR